MLETIDYATREADVIAAFRRLPGVRLTTSVIARLLNDPNRCDWCPVDMLRLAREGGGKVVVPALLRTRVQKIIDNLLEKRLLKVSTIGHGTWQGYVLKEYADVIIAG